jgi:enamine deaminase RidA (YjgF/YER057c/UK114 family)
VFAAGQLASDYQTGVPAEARKHPSFPFYGSDIKLQTQYILTNLARTFQAAGTSLDRVIKAQVFLSDLNHFNGFDEVVEAALQGAAAAHHGWDTRPAGEGCADRDRPDRGALTGGRSESMPRHPRSNICHALRRSSPARPLLEFWICIHIVVDSVTKIIYVLRASIIGPGEDPSPS